jgi:hypothetical protein
MATARKLLAAPAALGIILAALPSAASAATSAPWTPFGRNTSGGGGTYKVTFSSRSQPRHLITNVKIQGGCSAVVGHYETGPGGSNESRYVSWNFPTITAARVMLPATYVLTTPVRIRGSTNPLQCRVTADADSNTDAVELTVVAPPEPTTVTSTAGYSCVGNGACSTNSGVGVNLSDAEQ